MKKLALLFLLTGCVLPAEQYVQADKATYDVIANRYLNYVEQDPTLPLDEKTRQERLVQSWKLRLDKAGAK